MFNLEEYKLFVQSKLIAKAIYHKQDITERLLEAIYQLEQPIALYLYDIPHQVISKKYKTMFGYLDKPRNMPYNEWFLRIYGYKYCSHCKVVKAVELFGSNTARTDNLSDHCSECKRIQQKSYRKDNPHITNANSARRRAYMKQALPAIQSEQDRLKILDMYAQAKLLEQETGIKYHVDHIIPISKGGMHIPSNLQILTAVDNLKKGAKISTT